MMTYGSSSYTYNADGIRKSKTVNGATTTFNLVGSTILSQTKGGQTLVFLYDGNGSLIGFKDLSTDKDYFYLKNLQGDIVKIIDTNKTVVATYEYDDWGKLLTSDADLTDIAELNPFRYRGYYYDTESSLYYLNSRYYDPETGRFVNADAYVSTGQGLSGNNMFAYCNDNPINMVDSDGNKPYGKLNILDYYAIHKMVQIDICTEKWWLMEVGVYGDMGIGYMDIYDPYKHEFYEVKSEKAYLRNSTRMRNQMKKYETSPISGYWAQYIEHKTPATRGTDDKLSGSFIYGKYDVHYESKGNGFVTYDPVVNPVREAIGNIVSSIAVGMMTGSVFSSVASSSALISGGAMFGFAY